MNIIIEEDAFVDTFVDAFVDKGKVEDKEEVEVEDNTVAESSVAADKDWEELEQSICWYKYLPCCNNNVIISLGPYSFY